MNKVRFFYSKTGRAKYISHLDFIATMQRAVLRAGIKLKYSEGFNPHPYLSAALPLSVGCESIYELMDVGTENSMIPDKNKITLPEGILVHDIYIPNRKFNDIAWIKINGSYRYSDGVKSDIIKKISEYYDNDNIIITKRTKRGVKELDIAPYIKDIMFDISDDFIFFSALISAQNPVVNTGDLINVLPNELKPEHSNFKRIELYDKNMVLFK